MTFQRSPPIYQQMAFVVLKNPSSRMIIGALAMDKMGVAMSPSLQCIQARPPKYMGVTMSQSLGVQSFRPEGDFAHLILSAS